MKRQLKKVDFMTEGELGLKLDALKPGDDLTLAPHELANIFNPGGFLDGLTVAKARAFAEAHGCMLWYDEYSREPPRFQRITEEDGTPMSSIPM